MFYNCLCRIEGIQITVCLSTRLNILHLMGINIFHFKALTSLYITVISFSLMHCR